MRSANYKAPANWTSLFVIQCGLGKSYPSVGMMSVYSTAPANWTFLLVILCGLGESYPAAGMQSVYFTAPANWAFLVIMGVRGIVPLCWDAVSVFYCLRQLGFIITHSM